MDLLFETLFSSTILNRGFAYYLEGRVRDIESKGSLFFGIVSGNQDYNIEAEIIDGEIISLACDCPYGDNCKHEVAFLYALSDLSVLPKESSNMNHKTIIGNIPGEDLNTFINTYMRRDIEFANALKTKFSAYYQWDVDDCLKCWKNAFEKTIDLCGEIISKKLEELEEVAYEILDHISIAELQNNIIFKICSKMYSDISYLDVYDEDLMETIYNMQYAIIDAIDIVYKNSDAYLKSIIDNWKCNQGII